MDAERPSWIEVDLDALASNYAHLRSLAGPDVHIIAALKGNAYGHGIELLARRLCAFDVHAFAVGSLADAQAIRSASVQTPVLMFGGPLPEGLATLMDKGFTPTIYNVQSAQAVSSWALSPTDVFVKVDAGLGRLGIPIEAALSFIKRLTKLRNVRVAGLYTHLTFYDAVEMEWARERIAVFDALLDDLHAAGIHVPITQALASTALLTGLTSQANTVCPGSLLYGMCPVDRDLCDFSVFQPVLRSIKSKLIHVGENRGSRVGVVPLGVADGLRPTPPGVDVEALINGQRAKVAGVSLEYTNIDLARIDDATLGDDVIFVGQSEGETVTLDELSKNWGTSPLHTLMSFAAHLPRISV